MNGIKTYFSEFSIGNGRKVKVIYLDESKRTEKVNRIYEDYPNAVLTDEGYFYDYPDRRW